MTECTDSPRPEVGCCRVQGTIRDAFIRLESQDDTGVRGNRRLFGDGEACEE